MEPWNEADLLTGAKAFDPQALGAVYDRYSPGLYAYAMRLTGDECLAEDCVAETFSRFLKSLRSGHGPDAYLQAYLYRVAHNWITDQYRRQPPPPLDLAEDLRGDEDLQPEFQTQQRMEQARVRMALRALTVDQRQVIVLRFLEGWEVDAVAAALQKPAGAVKALQHRALAALRKVLYSTERGGPYAIERNL